MNKPVTFTDEVKEFIFQNYKGLFTQELVDLVNEKFGTTFTYNQIRHFKQNRKLKSGVYQKGRHFGKGKKQSEYMSEQAIKNIKNGIQRAKDEGLFKGKKPHNFEEIGTIKRDKNGLVKIKVGYPSEWEYYRRYVWEQANGKIPEGHVIFFMNGDSTDFRLENLRCIKKGHLALLNKWGLRSTESRELNEIGLNIVELITKIKDLERKE